MSIVAKRLPTLATAELFFVKFNKNSFGSEYFFLKTICHCFLVSPIARAEDVLPNINRMQAAEITQGMVSSAAV